MSDHFNDLTPAEVERLAFLMEECSEVIKVCAKVLRHGWRPADQSCNNRFDLTMELANIRFAMRLMFENDDVAENEVIIQSSEKKLQLNRWLRYNEVK